MKHEVNDKGQLECPKCGRAMVAFNAKGKSGWRCSASDFRFGRQHGCDGVLWGNQQYQKRAEVVRPATWIAVEPNEEQRAIKTHIGVRETRLSVINSGPGSGKSTNIAAHILPEIVRRVSNLMSWNLAAFNKNADESLKEKIPTLWPNVATFHSTFARLQGLKMGMNPKFSDVSLNKSRDIYFDLIKGQEEASPIGNLCSWVDRAKDSLLFAEADETILWNQYIGAIASNYPGLAEKLSADALENIKTYLPLVVNRSVISRKADFTDFYVKPALEAAKRIRWRINPDCIARSHVWTDDDISHLCELIRNIYLPAVNLIVDEAQDLSLGQIVVALACTYRQGELIVVGDDYQEEPYKAGQGIFGWRGAFPGSLEFIKRCWKQLTGEVGADLPLNETHRIPTSGVNFVRPSNTVLKTAKKEVGAVHKVEESQAFTYWINANDDARGGWITRRNAPLASVFLSTLKARKKCQLRGNGDITSGVRNTLYNVAGYAPNDGEYKVSLSAALAKLAEECKGEATSEDSLDHFILEVGREIESDPGILREAEIETNFATVANLRDFLFYFISHTANRVLSTVYRSKGDEFDYVIVADIDAFNTPWNGNEHEAAAVRHVACTRQRHTLLVCGILQGMDYSAVTPMPEQPTEFVLEKKVPVIAAEPKQAEPKRKPAKKADKKNVLDSLDSVSLPPRPNRPKSALED